MHDLDIADFESKIYKIKSEIDNLRPFSGIQLKNLQDWFKISFTAQSNAMEGNSFTEKEVKILLEDGITVGGKPLKEVKETENLASLTHIIWDFFEEKFEISNDFILSLHKDLLLGIENEYLGKYRDIQVYISGSSDILPSPKLVPELMIQFIDFCNMKNKNSLLKIAKIHYDFVKIHPFTDGNGRIARLLMNLYFVREGFLPIILPVITRLDYINSFGKDKTFEDFYKYFLWQTYENQKDYLRFFKN